MPIVSPMLVAWQQLRKQIATFDKVVHAMVKSDPECRLPHERSSIGVLSVLPTLAPSNTRTVPRRSRSVGAHLGLSRVDINLGRSTEAGASRDAAMQLTRTLLYEAAA